MLNTEIIRFVIVGFINTIFGYSVFMVLIFLKLNPINAIVITTCAGVLFNFKSISKYVFKKNDNHLIYKFVLLYFILLMCNIIFFKSINFVIDNNYIAGIVSMFITSVLSFFSNRHFIFKPKID